MDVDDDTIVEIKENTAVTREKVENLEYRLKSKDNKIDKNAIDISDNEESISENETQIARLKAIGAVVVFVIATAASMHGWIVPLI